MTRILLTLLCLMTIPYMALAAGFNTTGDGLLVSYSGSALPSQGGATIAEIVDILQSGVFDPTTGLPAAGGRAYFYAPGTTTLKDVYADGNILTVANNPVVLNSAGVATVYGYGTYKIVITNSRGQRIYTYPAVRYIGGPDIVSVFDVHDKNDTSYLTRIITDQVNSGMSAVYATESTNGVILPIKFGASLTSSAGLYVTNNGTRIGINTASPTVALNVVGDFKSSGSITGASLSTGSGSISGGPISGGAITGTSLSTGSGSISGGAITGTSLSTGGGAISGGAITGTSLSTGGGAISGGAITGTTGTFSGNTSADISVARTFMSIHNNPGLYLCDTDTTSGFAEISFQHYNGSFDPRMALHFYYDRIAGTNSVRLFNGTAITYPLVINHNSGMTIGADFLHPDMASWNGSMLYVNGKQTVSGVIHAASGDISAPSYSFMNAPTAGMSLTANGLLLSHSLSPGVLISSGGNVTIGSTTDLASPFYKFYVYGSASMTEITTNHVLSTMTSTGTLRLSTPGTGTGTMLGIDMTSTSKEVILLTSSQRFKRDIRPYKLSWDKFMSLQPVTYKPKDNPTSKPLNGFTAEDVQKVYPGVVQMDDQGKPFSIDYGRLVSPAVAAVQELKRMVDERDLKIASLEARLDEMEKRIRKIEKLVEGR